MTLKKFNSRGVKSTLALFIFILVSSSILPGFATIHHFEEDFTDPNMDIWTFRGLDWSKNNSNPVETDDNWIVTNGELVSGGVPDSQNLNDAYIEDHTAFGTWSFDVSHPEGAPYHQPTSRTWGILFSDLVMGTGPNQTFWSMFGLNVFNNQYRFQAFNGTPDLEVIFSKTDSSYKYDQYQRYDLVRTEDRFYVIVDNLMLMNFSLPANIGPVINFFTIETTQGSNVKFDNIAITTDTQLALDNVIDPPVPPGEGVGFPVLPVVIGIGVIGIVSGIYYWKKKSLKN